MNSIDLISFLRNYYGIINNELKANKLTHFDVKILFPKIRRVSKEFLECNLHDIYKGNIILVYDCKGRILHYLHPHLLIDVRCADEIYEQDENYIDISSIDLDSLSKDELLNLRKKVKKNCQRASERAITKVIKRKRDKEVVDYKRKKLMLRMEEL